MSSWYNMTVRVPQGLFNSLRSTMFCKAVRNVVLPGYFVHSYPSSRHLALQPELVELYVAYLSQPASVRNTHCSARIDIRIDAQQHPQVLVHSLQSQCLTHASY